MTENPQPTEPLKISTTDADLAAAEAAATEMAVAADADTASPATAPDDANDLRGYHFKKLLGEVSTWVIIAIIAAVAGVGVAIYLASVALGGGAAFAVLLLSIIAVFAIADSRAADAFFVYYAKENGLTLGGHTPLPPATPLLRKGDDRYAERTLTGELAEGVNGTLALYTYEETHTDSDGNRDTDYYRYTVGLIEIPECAGFIPELYVQRKFGLKALEKLEDAFRGDKERVKFESAELDKRFEIFVDEKQDQNWLRQLFSPTFIVWLLQKTPNKFAFELVGGTLCCYAKDHKEKAADLDRMRAATAVVARRLREESLE
jgi:hypothetical protein